MKTYTRKVAPTTQGVFGIGKATRLAFSQMMGLLISLLTKIGLLKKDLDYHIVRASMIIIFLFFGYQKWFEYEAQGLIPFISNGPLISWMYPVFGIQGASWFLGVSEWLFGALLFLGFWNKKLGILGALGSCVSFIMTVSIIPFMPNGWAGSAGGFPAMTGNVPLPYEGRGSFCCIHLFAKAGRNESVASGGFRNGHLDICKEPKTQVCFFSPASRTRRGVIPGC
jgi:uncharacterized membrane protein YkgB